MTLRKRLAWTGSSAGLCSVIALALLGAPPASAHNGFSFPAPFNAIPGITIDGAAGEAAWGAGNPAGLLPNTCTELTMGTGSPILVSATKDAANTYLAFTIPDTSPSSSDKLFLFFDANHSASAGLQADDVALELPFGNTIAANQSFAGALKYTVAAGAYAAPVALPAAIEARYSRTASGLVVELKIPFTQVSPPVPTDKSAVGFALVYLNQATDPSVSDCDMDGAADAFKVAWPTGLAIAVLPTSVSQPSLWGDLGKDVGTVGFVAPLCCYSPDITFSQSGNPMVQPFAPGVPVDIQAEPHAQDHQANNVNVEVRVHDFGTGGAAVFTAAAVVPSIAAGASAKTAPVTWPSPPPGMHGCIRAEVKPPTMGQPEYAIKAGFEIAQYNTDVDDVARGGMKRMMFKAFNPDQKQAKNIKLLKQEILPADLHGLTFELVQPEKALAPQEAVEVALVARAAKDAPVTDVPRQKVHVPPTAEGPGRGANGGQEPVKVAVRPGDRVYLTATGDVDVDGRGPIPSTGPEGRDVSHDAPGGESLLAGGSRFGGALIGSFDGFATSFLIGSRLTLTVPEKAQGLWLAVNDVTHGHRDNTGAGFDVVVATLPPLPGAEKAARAIKTAGGLPQVTIVATSTEDVRVGDHVYHVVSAVGGVNFEVLVREGAKPPSRFPLWLILLLLLLLVVVFLSTRRKSA